MEIISIFEGESLTINIVISEPYDMARLKSHKLYIGARAVTGDVIGNTILAQLPSEYTHLLLGLQPVTLWMDDLLLGVRKTYVGDVLVRQTNAREHNGSTSEVHDVVIPVTVGTTTITVEEILYNYMKGDSAYQLWLDAGNTGTVEDYLASLKGDPFLYSDFTPEQLEALKVKGDPFLYEDFTPEQIAELQQPATDAAADAAEVVAGIEQDALAFQQAATTLINNKMSDVDTAEGLRNTAEGLRATAEGTRQQNEIERVNAENDRDAAEALRVTAETTRGQNEQERITAEGLRVTAEGLRQTNTATAIQNANNAATNANTKAGLADTAANNANEAASRANQADVTQLAVEMNSLTKPLTGSFTYKSQLDTAFPSGNSGLFLIVGNVKEVDTLTITGGATTNGNFGVLLNGTTFYTTVLSGDTADTVASKIRANTVFQGWTVSGSGATIIFTDNQSRAVVAPSINPTLTGVTGTFVRTTLGVAPDGKWYYWNGSAWVAGGEYMAILNTLENYKLETLKKTYTGAINELNTAKNELSLLTEKLAGKRQPLYIEMGTFTFQSDAPSSNANAIIAVTSQSLNVLSGDFSIWGSTKIIQGVVEFNDGTYGTGLILSYTSTTATFAKPFDKTVVKCSCIHDAVNGQHLSDLGYYAMAQHLFNYPKRKAFRQTLVNGVSMQHHSRLSVVGNHVVFKDNLTNKIALEIDVIGGYNPAFVNIVTSALDYWKIAPYTMGLNNSITPQIGSGWEIPFSSDYVGFVELYLGSNIALAGKLCEVKLLKDGSVVETKQFSGAVEKVVFNHEIGNYKIQITSLEVSANPALSAIYFWKKREITESIWSKDDRILFLTDSWGAYPEATNPELKPKQFDGTPSSGMSYMPIKFKDYFVAMGGRASNIFLATRGGQTSEWAKYWLPYAIAQTRPTKIVLHFGINDYNSTDEYAGNVPSGYDFDPDIMFASKYSNAGGVFGSVSKQRYEDNINWIAEYCANKGITPIFFMPPKVASAGQAQGLQQWSLDIYAEGLKNIN